MKFTRFPSSEDESFEASPWFPAGAPPSSSLLDTKAGELQQEAAEPPPLGGLQGAFASPEWGHPSLEGLKLSWVLGQLPVQYLNLTEMDHDEL